MTQKCKNNQHDKCLNPFMQCDCTCHKIEIDAARSKKTGEEEKLGLLISKTEKMIELLQAAK